MNHPAILFVRKSLNSRLLMQQNRDFSGLLFKTPGYENEFHFIVRNFPSVAYGRSSFPIGCKP